MKKYLVLLAMTLLSLSTEANNGNDGFVTVTNFVLWTNTYNAPQIRLIVQGDTYYNPSNCAPPGLSAQTTPPDSYMVSTSLPEKVQDRIYSALLSAIMAKKSVVLRIENNGCESGRPSIMNVVIQ